VKSSIVGEPLGEARRGSNFAVEASNLNPGGRFAPWHRGGSRGRSRLAGPQVRPGLLAGFPARPREQHPPILTEQMNEDVAMPGLPR